MGEERTCSQQILSLHKRVESNESGRVTELQMHCKLYVKNLKESLTGLFENSGLNRTNEINSQCLFLSYSFFRLAYFLLIACNYFCSGIISSQPRNYLKNVLLYTCIAIDRNTCQQKQRYIYIFRHIDRYCRQEDV